MDATQADGNLRTSPVQHPSSCPGYEVRLDWQHKFCSALLCCVTVLWTIQSDCLLFQHLQSASQPFPIL